MKTIKILLIVICMLTLQLVQSRELQVLVKNQGETYNFELAGQKNWDYDLKRVKGKENTKILLIVKTTDESSISKISNIENPFVRSVQVKQMPQESKWLIEFVLKDDTIDTFDYLTDQPSKLIVDFYVNESKRDALIARGQEKPKTTEKKKKPQILSANRSDQPERKPAQADYLKIDEPGGIETSTLLKAGLSDGADSFFSRFVVRDVEINERSILKSDNNYYLKFPMLEMEFLFWNTMKKNPPIYQFQDEKSEENKQVKLLKLLFDKKRYLVFKQTADWFENKFPKSKYLESIAYMKGDALQALWRQENNDKFYELAQFAYTQALSKYPTSALAERTSLMLGLLAVDKLDFMTAIRRFASHIENNHFKDRISNEYARLGLGYSYSKINKLSDAVKEMDNLEKDSKNELVQAEAAFRRADFYFDANQFDGAISNYNAALLKYEKHAGFFPNTPFNKMESFFWKKKYKEAHQSGLEFGQKFPSPPFAPYALTRVGELLEILGAEQSRAIGSFLETYFRYGDSPKTIVAQLHLLSTRMKGMKEEELQQTLVKMEALSKKSELINVDQFKTTMISDGFTRRMEYEKAIQILSDFFQKNPNRPDSKQVTRRIVRNIFDQIKYFSDNGKYRDVLKTYQKYADTWLKHQDRIDTDFYLGLAYEKAGDFEVALEKYKKTYQNMQAVKGTEREKWISVTESLPSEDELSLRIADCYFQAKDFQSAYTQLEKIKNPHLLGEVEQVQRVQLASHLYEQKGDLDTAMRYLSELIRVWNGKPELTVDALMELADMQYKKNSIADAKESLKKVVDIAVENKKVNPRQIVRAANFSANIYLKENQQDEAAKRYSFILEKYDDQLNLAEERFKLGEIYFKKGELKRAETIWSKLRGENAAVWTRISRNKLQEAQWNDDYKKYLKRIPAMSQMEAQQ